MTTTSEASSREEDGQQHKGLIGSLFGGKKKVAKAKLGLEMQMYYHEELKCWVMPGEEEDKRKEVEGLRAPPQMPSSSSMASQQQSLGAGQTQSSLSSRYAAMPTMSVGAGSGQQGSILAGLKPPPLGGGAGMGQQPFKPMAVFNPSAVSSGDGERLERRDSTSIWEQQQQQEETDAHNHADVDAMTATSPSPGTDIDPLVLEVLSFWSYYRGHGYDVDVMKEWVCENYSDDVSRQLDCEALLKDEGISSAVDVYMQQHRQHEGVGEEHTADYTTEYAGEDGVGGYGQPEGEQQVLFASTGHEEYPQIPQDECSPPTGHGEEAVQYSDTAIIASPKPQEEGAEEQQWEEDAVQQHVEYETYHFSAAQVEIVDESAAANTDGVETYAAPSVEAGYATPAVGTSPEKPEQELNEFGLPMPTVYHQHDQNVVYTDNAVFDESAMGSHGWNASPGSVVTLSSHGDAVHDTEQERFGGPPVETETLHHDQAEEDVQMSREPIPSGFIHTAELGGYGDAPGTDSQDTVLASRAALQELEDSRLALQEAKNTIEEQSGAIEMLQNSMDSTIGEKNAIIADLEETLDGVRAEVSALEAELHGQSTLSRETEEQHEAEVAELKQRIFDLEGESDELRSRIEALQSDSNELQEAKEQIGRLEDQLQTLSRDDETISELERENQRLLAQVESVKEDSEGELQKLQKEKEALEESLRDEMLSIQNDFQSMLDERDAEIMQLEARVMLSENAVQTAKEEAKQEITAEIQASFEENKAELEALLESKEVELADNLHRIQEQEKKFAAAKKKIQAQTAQIEKLSEEMEALRERAESGDSAIGQIERISEECNELKAFIETLQKRMDDAECVHANEIETLVQENNQLMDTLSDKEDHLEQMNAELAQLRSTVEQAQAVESQISHWEEAASAAQDALMAEKAAKDMAQAQYDKLEHQLHEMTQNLNDARNQVQNMSQLQSELEHKHDQVQALHVQCEEYELRLQSANMTIENAQTEIEELSKVLQENPPGAANEELESEIRLLRHQLAALSTGASQKEEELRKYKLQLVKAKKLRAIDQEKIDELQELQEEYESKLEAAIEAMNAENDTSMELASLQQKVADVTAENQEHEESLNDALTALGQEEAKVSRLVELLSIAGLTEAEIQEELDAVTEEVGYGDLHDQADDDDDVM